MSEYISLNLTAEVLETSDIIVVVGGSSGTAAAISAARLGKKVVLLEQSGVLGGMSTLANVATFMPVGNITGIFKEICSQIVPETLVNPNVGNYAPQFNPLLMRYKCEVICRHIIGSIKDKPFSISLKINGNFENNYITEAGYLSKEESKILHTFDDMKIEVPLPFKENDYVIEKYRYLAIWRMYEKVMLLKANVINGIRGSEL